MNEPISPERARKGWYWPLLLGGLMAIVIGANLTLLVVASSDPSFAVEEDYYQKGLDWDRKLAQDRVNTDLGWTVELEVARQRAADGTIEIEVRLAGPDGEAISDARVELEMFHNARAANVFKSRMVAGGDGTYRVALPLNRPGRWELRLSALQSGRRFTHTTVEELYWR